MRQIKSRVSQKKLLIILVAFFVCLGGETMLGNTVYVIEDNFIHRSKIIHYLEQYGEDKIVALTGLRNIEESVNQLTIGNNDIFLIDIELNQYIDGIQISKIIRTKNKFCFIVFITADNHKAIKVINNDIRPTGYIVKSTHLDKVRKQLHDSLQSITLEIQSRMNTGQWFIVKSLGVDYKIPYKEIDYFETLKGERNKVLIVNSETDIIINISLKTVRKQLADVRTWLSLKSYLLNLNNIMKIDTRKNAIIFSSHKELYVGERIINKVRKVWESMYAK